MVSPITERGKNYGVGTRLSPAPLKGGGGIAAIMYEESWGRSALHYSLKNGSLNEPFRLNGSNLTYHLQIVGHDFECE